MIWRHTERDEWVPSFVICAWIVDFDWAASVEQYIPTRGGHILMHKQDAPNGISTRCLVWPHLFPLYASQIFLTI